VRCPLALLVVTLLGPAAARADGAFPDSMRILLPPDHPEQLMLGTNFGLVVSSDGGGHWFLVCEEALATAGENVTQYLTAAPPAGTLYAMSSNQLALSEDRGCTWTSAGGAWSDPFFTDTFADPSDPGHLLSLALVRTGAGWLASSLFESRDGGRSFGAPVFQAAQGMLITGVETAASAPQTIYLTEFGNPGGAASSWVARSTDAGRSFQEVSLLASLGEGEPRLAAVDPTDADVIYYRVVGRDDDLLGISRDGGKTARVALALQGPMTTFFRRADGTLLVGSKLQGAFLSHDGGQNFAPWPEAPHLRALGERAGVLYAVADNSADHFAVGSSSDGGKTWTPLLRFENLCGIRDCSAAVRTTCQPAWLRLVDLLGITGCSLAGQDAGGDSAVAPGTSRGCACDTVGGQRGGEVPAAFLAAVLALSFRRRRRVSLRE
jgi:MYXO-CTERM domain-containing protein